VTLMRSLATKPFFFNSSIFMFLTYTLFTDGSIQRGHEHSMIQLPFTFCDPVLLHYIRSGVSPPATSPRSQATPSYSRPSILKLFFIYVYVYIYKYMYIYIYVCVYIYVQINSFPHQVWRLSSSDLAEIARNSVLQSSFNIEAFYICMYICMNIYVYMYNYVYIYIIGFPYQVWRLYSSEFTEIARNSVPLY